MKVGRKFDFNSSCINAQGTKTTVEEHCLKWPPSREAVRLHVAIVVGRSRARFDCVEDLNEARKLLSQLICVRQT